MTRCTVCIYPDTRPDAHFVGGVCSACRAYEQRKLIDWDIRDAALCGLLLGAQMRKAPYDAVVPISGGKDSTYQVLELVKRGIRVLGVNAGTDMISDIGRRNLDNLKRFCDVIEWTPCQEVRKKLMRIGLRCVGDLSYPEHLAIWSIPTRVAVLLGIPLVVWGEQPQREYAAPEGVAIAERLTSRWVAEFGGMLGLRLYDVIGMEGLTEEDVRPFRFPNDAELESAGVQGIWLGDFVDWDGWKNALTASFYGFEVFPTPVETSLANYENLDNHVTVLRDWIRYLKYGYSRATDIACNHIRRGRMLRSEALRLCEQREIFPRTSLGKPIIEVLDYIGITLKEFNEECSKWASQSASSQRS